MFCECTNPITSLVSVGHLRWQGNSFRVAPRRFASLSYRIRGNAVFDANGHTYTVRTGEVLYFPQGLPYTVTYTDTEMLAIDFVTDRADALPEVYTPANADRLYKAFLHAHLLWQNKQPGYAAYVQARLYDILGMLSEGEAASLPPHFTDAVAYVHAHYTRSTLSVEEICRTAGIGGTGLRQLFRQHYGKTPVEYITDLRLEYARELISCGTAVERAAEQSGFNDAKYFARVVKKRMGCTPRELKLYGK